jgi:hypothetical protein
VERDAEPRAADHAEADIDLAELHALRTELKNQMNMVGEEIQVKARRLQDYTSLALKVEQVRHRHNDRW